MNDHIKPESLSPAVVGIKAEACVNCHACITACPVKFCNDGKGDHVTLDPALCIGCGRCLVVCTHGARYYIDDFERLLEDLRAGIPILAVAAPSIVASFPGEHLNLNGWLASLGVSVVFDVSFGAELAVNSCAEHLRKRPNDVLIAQPCPVIVTYIERYVPELLPYLAPVDSPMGHCVKMIREYFPEYANHRIAMLSPCISKRREMAETGLGEYNVGFTSIAAYLDDNGIDLADYPALEYAGPKAGLAVVFPRPGGLKRSLARWMPEVADDTRTIEGGETVFQYLRRLPESIRAGTAPRFIDCLSCDHGCSAGPLTRICSRPLDEVEHWIEDRRRAVTNESEEVIASLKERIRAFWSDGLYRREYDTGVGGPHVRTPDEEELRAIFARMHKYSEKDIYNCTACGYMSCRDMATAIFNGKNKPENCHFFLAREAQIAHEKIEQREIRFRSILETTLEGFMQVNNDYVIEMVNESLCSMLGRQVCEMVGHSLFEFVAEEAHDELKRQTQMRSLGQRSVYDIDLVHANGGHVHTLFSASPLFDVDGNKIGAFALVSNITERKEAEEELQRSRDELERRVEERTLELSQTNTSLRMQVELNRLAEEALRDSESRLQAIVHGCPFPQFVIDRSHRVISWNRPLEEYSGIKEEEVAGTSDHWRAFYLDPRPCLADVIVDGVNAEISKWYGDKCAPSRLVNGAFEVTDFFPRMGENGRWLYFIAALIRDKAGAVIGAVETFEDITERRSSEQARLELERQVQHAQKLESLGVLAGGLAHDFNNLLAAILGNADLAMMNLPEDAGARSNINVIASIAERAADLANQMLAYSGKGKFAVKPVDLSKLVSEMTHLLGVSISKKAELKLNLAEGLPMVQADATQLQQVVMNLITNASEAMGETGGTITITTYSAFCDRTCFEQIRPHIATLPEGQYVCLEVSDTGTGMASETLERVFDPFFTTKFAGRGLGLSAVSGIVRAHKGAIDVRSTLGVGTQFRVLFPSSGQTTRYIETERKQDAGSIRKATVMVVDDEDALRTATAKYLSVVGFTVLTAENGRVALDLFRERPDEIDAVILDLTMPEMDGCETLAEMRKIKPDIRALMSSGYHEHELEQRFAGKGFSAFIQKPYRLDTLRAILLDVLAAPVLSDHKPASVL